MKSVKLSLIAILGSALLFGANTKAPTKCYKVIAERGAILNANITDANGSGANEVANGHYCFSKPPKYPVILVGGFIDLDKNKRVSNRDIDNPLLLVSTKGRAITIVTTIAKNTSARNWLKSSFRLNDNLIDNGVPSRNRVIAGISDEIFRYCIRNKIKNPSNIPLTTLKRLEAPIKRRIRVYRGHKNIPTIAFENSVVNNLGMERIGDKSPQQTNTNTIVSNQLSDEQKYSLAYMWNEEKLAKDIYLALNKLTPHNTLYNIATRSEVRHEASVENLVKQYDINITNLKDYTVSYSEEELRALKPGEYAVPEVQELYNALYEKGSKSLKDALEVGCMVEVTDVNDLDEYIEIAKDNSNLISTFDFLRRGSYNHYWAFDRALKNLGVKEGCCVLGSEYCKTKEEYPSSNNQSNGNGYGNGNGNGNGYGKANRN